ncbi:hypothetical protein MQ089_10635 [Edwardsiella anguillarum]|uniref:hypothetical protein n=1 Tax=Edwardsiella anguillarum TaxID=1821960 RepID=UPI0024B64497|nr:hypothetical protein [Edwardsiella anguillarum]WHQ16380.1 hypothetical protein MQ085_10645 [Edwardsiella anguillarum]WHQ19913.1 hypothetical protein MQ089_10635 [Edwardsiella anguillarum]WHQ23436.1 hypothetical protein MQ094_10650 [Edwardsiella anguillarum]WHQ27009.1 hypothetical protein MQ093_10865 [Edwardsiella anguillarum]
MNPVQFIHSNVKSVLVKQGYDPNVALMGADIAVEHYRRCSQASKKGAIFDDCVRVGKSWADMQGRKPKGRPKG